MRKFELRTGSDSRVGTLSPAPSLRVEQEEDAFMRLSESPEQIEDDHDEPITQVARSTSSGSSPTPSDSAHEEGYAPLEESPEQSERGMDEEEGEADPSNEATARFARLDGDPLADVFGQDAETWSDIQSSRPDDRHVHDTLALDGAALSSLPDLKHDQADIGELDGMDPTRRGSAFSDGEAEEVMDLWNAFDKPRLSISIPDPEGILTPKSPPVGGRRHIPPPLTILPNSTMPLSVAAATPSPSMFSEGSGTRLPYLVGSGTPTPAEDETPHGGAQRARTREDSLTVSVNGDDEERFARRSPAEEKREGGVFDDLDLDLDLSTFDDTVEVSIFRHSYENIIDDFASLRE